MKIGFKAIFQFKINVHMKIIKILTISSIIIVLTAYSSFNGIEPQEIAGNNNVFTFDLYRVVANKEHGNIFFSPFSISTALAMTYAGADGETAKQMAKAMQFFPNNSDFHQAYGKYIQMLEKNAQGNIQLRIANKLWGEKSFKIESDFMKLNKLAYNSPLVMLDFINKPDACRKVINDWIAESTEQKILDLIPFGGITSSTKLVLTNAIYFKGDWLYKFDKARTKDRIFYLSDGSQKETSFMNSRQNLKFKQTNLYKAVLIPYKGNMQSMVIILPNYSSDLKKIEEDFRTENFLSGLNKTADIILSIPKFNVTLPLNLNSYLSELGMKAAFQKNADFTKICKDSGFFISDVIHKVFIEIDENGTEAAAATAVVMKTVSVSMQPKPKPIKFIADHPFIFYIIDNQTSAILFMGKIVDPTTK